MFVDILERIYNRVVSKMKKIKLYRFTIKHTEPLPEGEVVSYHQTDWSSLNTLIPYRSYQEIVKTEEKEIEIDE